MNISETTYTQESIAANIKKWVAQHFDSFEFRENQLESITQLIDNILNKDIETTVMQAPTGTGKSIITIITAGVLAQFYDMKSYILASDLYLWNQYAAAITKFNLKQFGYLKGSIGNYKCHINNMDFSCGKCRIQKVGISQLRNREWRMAHGWSCAENCLYMKQRFRAEMSPVSLLTYQLWLYQMNLVNHDDNTGFIPRKVIFCDECHNIPDIVQKYAQPTIDIVADRDKIKQILEYAFDNDITAEWNRDCVRPDVLRKFYDDDSNNYLQKTNISDLCTITGILDEYDYFVDCLQLSEKYDANKADVKYDIIRDYCRVLSFVATVAENALDKLSEQKDDASADSKVMTNAEKKDFMTSYKLMSWMHNYYSSILEYTKAAHEAGLEYIVVEENKTRETGHITYTLACIKEDYLCYKYLLAHSPYKVMMSATVGNKRNFADNVGVKYSEKPNSISFMDIPNIFNFEKSPIYYIPTYKMSYARKKYDFPKIQQIVYRILMSPNFIDKHGMINTGSYENAKMLFDAAPPEIKKRICMYISSKDKADTIEKYKSRKDKIIIGPTLVEGVDLPDDLCRFIIIIKIPYPNISSKTVKSKMELFPMWYESTTSNTVIQNIGRGVRNENDYCTTFILDGCFTALFENTKDQYPIELRNRIKLLNG